MFYCKNSDNTKLYIYNKLVFKIFILSNVCNNNILPYNLPITVNHCISFGWFPGLVINNVSCFLCVMVMSEENI